MKKQNHITLICLMATFCIAGCSSAYYSKRDIKRLDALSLQNTAEFARLSNVLNPCFAGPAKSDTVIKRSTDTIFNSVERFVTGRPGKPDTIYLPCKTIRNNVFTVIHDTIADNRALTACVSSGRTTADSLLIMKTKGGQLESEKSSLIKWLIGLIVIIISLLAFSVSKFLNGGAVISGLKKFI